MTKYDTGVPHQALEGYDWYVDLEEDKMYQWTGNAWELYSVNGQLVGFEDATFDMI